MFCDVIVMYSAQIDTQFSFLFSKTFCLVLDSFLSTQLCADSTVHSNQCPHVSVLKIHLECNY